MAILYLVRHGASIEQGMIRGRMPGYPLSEKGKREAKALADWFADRDVTAVYSSPLQRCYETAQFIAREKKLNVKLSEQLGEWYAPYWQGKHWNEVNKLQLLRYTIRPTTLNLGGERIQEVAERIADFCRTVSKRANGVVCVSHRDPILAGKLALTGKSLNWLNFQRCEPGSITVMDVGEETARQVGYATP